MAALLVFVAMVGAYNIEGGGICNCNSCSDCIDALNNNTNCNNTVKLTQNITNTGTCIELATDVSNKIFDGCGWTISGGNIGISLNVDNPHMVITNLSLISINYAIIIDDSYAITIEFVNISNCINGISGSNDISDSVFSYIRITNSTLHGIEIEDITETTFSNNVFCGNNVDVSVNFDPSYPPALINNRCNSTPKFNCNLSCGINCSSCSECNNAFSNIDVFFIHLNSSFSASGDCIDFSRNKPLYCQHYTITGNDTGTAFNISVSNSEFFYCNISHFENAFLINSVSGTKIHHNNISHSENGIKIINSTLSNISHNVFFNISYGIYQNSANTSDISYNDFENVNLGVFLTNISNTNTISFNNMTMGSVGIYLLNNATSNTLRNNTIHFYNWGIGLQNSIFYTYVYNNTLNNNSLYGLVLYAETAAVNRTYIRDNTIKYNGINGIIAAEDLPLQSYYYLGYISFYGNRVCLNPGGDLNIAGSWSGSDNFCDSNTYLCSYPCNWVFCDSCTSCNTYIYNPEYKYVRLTADIINQTTNCITTNSSNENKTFDCNSKKIDGNDTNTSIIIRATNNFTVYLCNISQYENGIEIHNSTNILIMNNTIHHIRKYALILNLSAGNITNNTFYQNTWARGYKNYSSNFTWSNNAIIVNYSCTDDAGCVGSLLFAIIAGGGLVVYYFRRV